MSKLIYKTLRIPAKPDTISNIPHKINYSEIVKLQSPDENISFAIMNEGVFIIDNTVALTSLNNKYLPAFILALNQREFLLKVMRLVPSVDVNELEELKSLKKFITEIYLKQISFSVSVYNEFDIFFTELQKKFKIKILMEDNKESINEIHELIEYEEKKIEDKMKYEEKKKADDNLITPSTFFTRPFGTQTHLFGLVFFLYCNLKCFMFPAFRLEKPVLYALHTSETAESRTAFGVFNSHWLTSSFFSVFKSFIIACLDNFFCRIIISISLLFVTFFCCCKTASSFINVWYSGLFFFVFSVTSLSLNSK